jgi:hypothetical protein
MSLTLRCEQRGLLAYLRESGHKTAQPRNMKIVLSIIALFVSSNLFAQYDFAADKGPMAKPLLYKELDSMYHFSRDRTSSFA